MKFERLSEEAVEHLKESGYRTASGECHNMQTSRESVEESYAYQLGIDQFIVEQKKILNECIYRISEFSKDFIGDMEHHSELVYIKSELQEALCKYDDTKKDLMI